MHYLYWIIDLACISLPLLFSFYPKIQFYKEWKWYLPACTLVAVLFLIWDEYFTEWGVWGFNTEYITGRFIFNLPVEEVAFFFCIPYACVFTYFVFKKLNFISLNKKALSIANIVILLFVLVILFIGFPRWYTSTTFLFCFIAIAVYVLFMKKTNLQYTYISYLAILPFFFLSNGILTGSFIPDEVVWYNNAENLNFRIFTIPFEDIWYGFLLISLNVFLYEKFKTVFN